jgi:hypothetical protein
MRPGSRPPPPQSAPGTRSTHRSKKADKQSFLSEPAFIRGYRAAYETIYERNDYASAIDQLKTLGHDDYANVANLIGYSYRKLGDYKLSQVWYERALKSELRLLADRAGQSRSGGIPSPADRLDLRHRLL